MAKKSSFYTKIDTKIKRISGTIAALTVVIGAVAGACSWVSNQFAEAVSSQISDFQDEVRDADKELQQSVTRVEILGLIEHDPENTVAIEKLARYYFSELKGDKWMSERYSRYARQHGLDETFVTGDK